MTKELEALEIIKEKRVDVSILKSCIEGNCTVEDYNFTISVYGGDIKSLNETEFDILKEVLK